MQDTVQLPLYQVSHINIIFSNETNFKKKGKSYQNKVWWKYQSIVYVITIETKLIDSIIRTKYRPGSNGNEGVTYILNKTP